MSCSTKPSGQSRSRASRHDRRVIHPNVAGVELAEASPLVPALRLRIGLDPVLHVHHFYAFGVSADDCNRVTAHGREVRRIRHERTLRALLEKPLDLCLGFHAAIWTASASLKAVIRSVPS